MTFTYQLQSAASRHYQVILSLQQQRLHLITKSKFESGV